MGRVRLDFTSRASLVALLVLWFVVRKTLLDPAVDEEFEAGRVLVVLLLELLLLEGMPC